MLEQRPQGSRHASGERHGGDFEGPPPGDARNPGTGAFGSAPGAHEHSGGAEHQERAQVLAASFRDGAETALAAAGMFVGAEAPAHAAQLRPQAKREGSSISRAKTEAITGPTPGTSISRFTVSLPLAWAMSLAISAPSLRHWPISTANTARLASGSKASPLSTLSSKPSRPFSPVRAVRPNPERATQIATAAGKGQRLGVARVGFDARPSAKRLTIRWRHRFHRVPKGFDLAAPVMRCPTRLERHRAARLLFEELQDLAPLQPPQQFAVAFFIDPMQLENALGGIHSNRVIPGLDPLLSGRDFA